jgi:hypothetical protein
MNSVSEQMIIYSEEREDQEETRSNKSYLRLSGSDDV